MYFVVIYYAIPAYYPELELQIVFLSGFNANHLYKAKSRKIEATGTQAELLASCPLYQAMWEAHISVKDDGEVA